ncbi:MAG: DUF2141 domain-containing protein [Candidatus Binataceae bacterium]
MRWNVVAASLAIGIVCGLGATARAQNAQAAVIRAHFAGLPSNTGRINCIIFNSADGFPSDSSAAAGKVRAPIENMAGTCDFPNLPAGTYAVAAYQDEHETGELTKNFIGVPTEAYGFSNDAHGSFGPPSFNAAAFSYPGGTMDITIHAQR